MVRTWRVVLEPTRTSTSREYQPGRTRSPDTRGAFNLNGSVVMFRQES